MKAYLKSNRTFLFRFLATICYFVFYLLCFQWLETHSTGQLHIITLSIDYQIPFLEVFVIPYLMWFPFIAGTVIYFMIHEDENFEALGKVLAFGMTLFLLVSWIYPNGLNLRPAILSRENIFTDLVRFLYRRDTSTNVLPSIHVFNSLAVYMAIKRSRIGLKNEKIIKWSRVLTILIILSTMFIKQHSVFDVVTAIALATVAEMIFYPTPQTEQRRKLRRQII